MAFLLPWDPPHWDFAQNDGGVVTSEVPRRVAWWAGWSRWREFCISSLGGKSGNFSADLVAGVFLIGLLVMAFLERVEKDEVWGHYMALG